MGPAAVVFTSLLLACSPLFGRHGDLLSVLAFAQSTGNVTNATTQAPSNSNGTSRPTNATTPSNSSTGPPSTVPNPLRRNNHTVTERVSRSQSTSPSGQVTPSASRTKSQPFRGGYLVWDRTPGVFDMTYNPVVKADILNTQNYVAELQLLQDSFDVAFLVARPQQAFRLLNVTLVSPRFVQGRGIIGQMAVGQVLTSSSLRWINTSAVEITFFRNSFLQLTTDEVLAVSFQANATKSKLKPINVATIRFTATSYPPQPGIFAALGVVTVANAALSIVLGVPGSHQLQAVAMIGSMSCVDAEVQAFTSGGEYFLVPFAVDPSPAGRLVSVIGVVGYWLAAHIISCRVIRSWVPRITMKEVMSRTAFPSVPYAVVAIGFPGYVYFLGRFLYQIIDGGLTVLVVSLALLFAVVLGVLLRLLLSSPSFYERRFQHDVTRQQSSTGIITKPIGRWGPPEIVSMYRSIIGAVAAHSDKFILIVFVESGVVAILAALESRSLAGCTAQFGVIAIFYMGIGILYAVRAPYRFWFDNVVSMAMCAALCCMTISGALTNSGSALIPAYQAALIVAIVAGAARCAVGLWVLISEECCAPPGPAHEAFARSPRVRLADARDDGSPPAAVPMPRARMITDGILIPEVESEGGSSDDGRPSRPASQLAVKAPPALQLARKSTSGTAQPPVAVPRAAKRPGPKLARTQAMKRAAPAPTTSH